MPVGVIVAEISLMSQMPPIYVMNRYMNPGDEATTATFQFVKCHEIVQRRRKITFDVLHWHYYSVTEFSDPVRCCVIVIAQVESRSINM